MERHYDSAFFGKKLLKFNFLCKLLRTVTSFKEIFIKSSFLIILLRKNCQATSKKSRSFQHILAHTCTNKKTENKCL